MSKSQSERYSRQILLKQVGEEGQEKLLNSHVLIVGAGGLGSPAALYLASAGVGHIGILDDDNVDLTNLQRQIIHSSESIGTPKVLSAKRRIEALNPDIKVSALRERLEEDNAKDIFMDYDFIMDATDNLQTKFLINDTCVRETIFPRRYSGIWRPAYDLCTRKGPLLPMYFSRTSRGWCDSHLSGGGGDRLHGRYYRHTAEYGGGEVSFRDRGTAHWQAAHSGCLDDGIPSGQIPEKKS